jgi:hypothetical protein
MAETETLNLGTYRAVDGAKTNACFLRTTWLRTPAF